MGPGQKFLTRVGSGQFLVARVRSGQPFMVRVWIWKILPKNVNFFSFGSKKISSDQVKKYLGQGWVGLFFTAGQKYARVESGQGPSLVWSNQPPPGLEIESSPKIPIFLPLGQKNLLCLGQKTARSKPRRPLIYCGSEPCSG